MSDRPVSPLPPVSSRTRGCRPTRVLVVEAQTAMRAVLAELIRREDRFASAGEATTSAEALTLLETDPRDPEIIVVSWLLDGGRNDPWAFVAALRLRCPGARFVMTCPKERATILRAARTHGIDVVYATRDSLACLRRALRSAAAGRPYLSPHMEEAVGATSHVSARGQEVLELMAEARAVPTSRAAWASPRRPSAPTPGSCSISSASANGRTRSPSPCAWV